MLINLLRESVLKKLTIIWDWNGTLLNDVDVSVDCMNKILKKRGKPLLDRRSYRAKFTFPVKNFYKSIGFNFDKEKFVELAEEFISLFSASVDDMDLFPEVISFLDYFKGQSYNQIILSAMEHKALLDQVDDKKISSYFSEIIGLNNILAKSKVDNAISYLSRNSINPDNCVLIGDTYHDYEVAAEIGCKCILINNGNQELDSDNINEQIKVIESLKHLNEVIDKIKT